MVVVLRVHVHVPMSDIGLSIWNMAIVVVVLSLRLVVFRVVAFLILTAILLLLLLIVVVVLLLVIVLYCRLLPGDALQLVHVP